MIKKISLLVLAISLVACNTTEEKKKETPKAVEFEKTNQEIKPQLVIKKASNKLVKDTVDGGMMLLGSVDREAFKKEEFKKWFKENSKSHQLDSLTINEIKPIIKDASFRVFMGTWCSDSQREIPAFYKVLKFASYDYNKVEMYAVDHEKETPSKIEKNFNIEYVPTIIVYKNGKELGRIVEYTQESLEKDLLAILSGSEYKHAYQD